MNKTAILLLASLGLTACISVEIQPQSAQVVGIVNTATEYCLSKGAYIERKKNAQGKDQVMCHFKDGTVVEEWEYYRQHHKK